MVGLLLQDQTEAPVDPHGAPELTHEVHEEVSALTSCQEKEVGKAAALSESSSQNSAVYSLTAENKESFLLGGFVPLVRFGTEGAIPDLVLSRC